jgi:hypothetical protein
LGQLLVPHWLIVWFHLFRMCKGHSSSVNKVTGYGVWLLGGEGTFFFSTTSRLALEPTKPLIK